MTPERELREALERIAQGELNTPIAVCNCTHDDENCCEKVGEWCPQCIAATALARAAAPAPTPAPPVITGYRCPNCNVEMVKATDLTYDLVAKILEVAQLHNDTDEGGAVFMPDEEEWGVIVGVARKAVKQ